MGGREKELQGGWAALTADGSVPSIRHAFSCGGKTLLSAQGNLASTHQNYLMEFQTGESRNFNNFSFSLWAVCIISRHLTNPILRIFGVILNWDSPEKAHLLQLLCLPMNEYEIGGVICGVIFKSAAVFSPVSLVKANWERRWGGNEYV